MTYMGSKNRYAKYIVPIIQKYIDNNNINCFVDCFCGGANLVDKIHCQTLIANDLSPTLIALHQQAQRNFNAIPADGSREYWDYAYAAYKKLLKRIREEPDTPLSFMQEDIKLFQIGAIEWYASFSNGGFPRGYAKNTPGRNYYQEAYRNHKKQAESENYKKIHFMNGDYSEAIPAQTDNLKILIYCDSPYRSTKPYAIAPKFDFDKYYNWLRETSKKYPIFVSEQWLPEDFGDPVWDTEVRRTAGQDNNFKATEKLWLLGDVSKC